MKKKKGFTLLEVLIVVVIAVSVAAFAFPAYKKTQDRNRFSAAQGVLIDLGNGVRMLRADISFNYPTSATSVPTSWQSSSLDQDTALTTSNAGIALFARKYMSPMPFDSGNSYKGYYYYICPENTASSTACCQSNSSVVACMYDSSYASRPTKGQYYGAAFYEDGSIKRLTK